MDFIHKDGWWLFPTLWWIFSAAVSALPELPQNAGFWATWLYRLAHALAANKQQLVSSFKKAST